VYRPTRASKGSGDREISDGLLVAGELGLILEVKSRSPDVAATDTIERATSWVTKNAAAAVRQAKGSRRALTARSGIRFVSMRGYERVLPQGDGWPIVVLIDHPHAPSIELPNEPNLLYMTMRDWMNLHDRLRSTASVIEYTHRALDSGLRPPLGQEHRRYRRLAEADADYATRPGTLPILPLERPSEEELFAVEFFDELVEKVADPANKPWDENNYLHIVELLDSQPILLRASIGTKMMDTFMKVRAEGKARGFGALDRLAGDRLVFYYDVEEGDDLSDLDEHHLADVAAYGALRHIHAFESGAGKETRTLAVGIRHHERFGRRYAFALYEGPAPPMDARTRRALEADHGIYDYGRGRIARRQLGRNEPCPCGSGRKFKHCCLTDSPPSTSARSDHA
jgi:hypothetical protein